MTRPVISLHQDQLRKTGYSSASESLDRLVGPTAPTAGNHRRPRVHGALFRIRIADTSLRMPIFDYKFTVNASLRAVCDFHSDTSALKRLTPPPTIVQLHEIEPLGEGSVSRFTLWVGPLPLRWRAVHRGVSERGFTDVQAEGPARKWEHTHTFIPVSADVTEIQEHIEFEHKPGFWGAVTRTLFARPNLLLMFAFRKQATRRYLRRQGIEC